MYKKAWCTCKVVVLLIKPIVFLTFSLPSASLDLKVPNNGFDSVRPRRFWRSLVWRRSYEQKITSLNCRVYRIHITGTYYN